MDIEALKAMPRQAQQFKAGDKVNTPVGQMVVTDPCFGETLKENVWIPKCRLAFMTKSGTAHKSKKHRIFLQTELSI